MLEAHKKQKKSQVWYNLIQKQKNAVVRIIGTLNLIFGSNPFEKNTVVPHLAIASFNDVFT